MNYSKIMYCALFIIINVSVIVSAEIVHTFVVLNLTVSNSTIQINSDKQAFMFDNRDTNRQFKLNIDVNATNFTTININATLPNVTIIINESVCGTPINQSTLMAGFTDELSRSNRVQMDNFINVVSTAIVSPRKTLDDTIENLTKCHIELTSKEMSINASNLLLNSFRNDSENKIAFATQQKQIIEDSINSYQYIILLLIIGISAMFIILLYPLLSEAFGFGGRFA